MQVNLSVQLLVVRLCGETNVDKLFSCDEEGDQNEEKEEDDENELVEVEEEAEFRRLLTLITSRLFRTTSLWPRTLPVGPRILLKSSRIRFFVLNGRQLPKNSVLNSDLLDSAAKLLLLLFWLWSRFGWAANLFSQ